MCVLVTTDHTHVRFPEMVNFIGATKKGARNKEQNLENKEKNGGKKMESWAFLGRGNS